MRFPREFAVEVVGINTFSAEKRIDEFAIGCGSGSSVRTLAVTIIEGRAFPRRRLPKYLALIAIETDYFESVFAIGADAVRMQKLLTSFDGVLHGFRARHHGSLNGSRQKHTVAPNDRR